MSLARSTPRWHGALRGAVVLTFIALFAVASFDAEALGTGDAAPSFELPNLEGGGTLDLTQYRGKVVYLDFWASWCPPCLTSLPELEKMRKQMPAKEFQILAINVDKDKKKAKKFLEKNPVGYPSASDPDGKLPEKFGLKTMPTSYLIDRDGTIKMVHEGYRSGDMKTIKKEIKKLVEDK